VPVVPDGVDGAGLSVDEERDRLEVAFVVVDRRVLVVGEHQAEGDEEVRGGGEAPVRRVGDHHHVDSAGQRAHQVARGNTGRGGRAVDADLRRVKEPGSQPP